MTALGTVLWQNEIVDINLAGQIRETVNPEQARDTSNTFTLLHR